MAQLSTPILKQTKSSQIPAISQTLNLQHIDYIDICLAFGEKWLYNQQTASRVMGDAKK